MASAVCSRRLSETSSRSSLGTNATFLTQGGRHAMGKGAVLFTGPSGIRDYKVKVVTDDRMVGIGTMSEEGTSEIRYIWREAPGTAPPQPRSSWVGEVGWLIPQFNDWRSIRSGYQMTQSEFRKAQEEKFTHRWQEPWYPAPNHPDYNKQYKFRNLPRTDPSPIHSRSKTPSPYATPSPNYGSPYKRPHTVASFRHDDSGNLPNIDSQSYSSNRPSTAHYSSTSEHSVSRPPSGAHTPVGSRPPSGPTQQSHLGSGSHAGSRPPSGAHTPVGSRPPSGPTQQSHLGSGSHAGSRPHSVTYDNRDAYSGTHTSSSRPVSGTSNGHYSQHSRRSSVASSRSSLRHSGGSRRSSASGSKRMAATPKSTSVSSQYGGSDR